MIARESPSRALFAVWLPTLWVSVAGAALSTLSMVLSPLVRMRDLPSAPTAPR